MAGHYTYNLRPVTGCSSTPQTHLNGARSMRGLYCWLSPDPISRKPRRMFVCTRFCPPAASCKSSTSSWASLPRNPPSPKCGLQACRLLQDIHSKVGHNSAWRPHETWKTHENQEKLQKVLVATPHMFHWAIQLSSSTLTLSWCPWR